MADSSLAHSDNDDQVPYSPASTEQDDNDILGHIRNTSYDDASVEVVINKSGESLSRSLYRTNARDRLVPAITLSEETLQPLSKAPRASTASSVDRWNQHVPHYNVRRDLSPSPSKSPLPLSPLPQPPPPTEVSRPPPLPISPERRAYPCDRCDRVFQNRSELR